MNSKHVIFISESVVIIRKWPLYTKLLIIAIDHSLSIKWLFRVNILILGYYVIILFVDHIISIDICTSLIMAAIQCFRSKRHIKQRLLSVVVNIQWVMKLRFRYLCQVYGCLISSPSLLIVIMQQLLHLSLLLEQWIQSVLDKCLHIRLGFLYFSNIVFEFLIFML